MPSSVAEPVRNPFRIASGCSPKLAESDRVSSGVTMLEMESNSDIVVSPLDNPYVSLQLPNANCIFVCWPVFDRTPGAHQYTSTAAGSAGLFSPQFAMPVTD